jgi:predicted phosphate transport protein (TIGR00153 family)
VKTTKLALFGKTKAMEGMIDDFLDRISEGGMRFEQGIADFVDAGFTGKLPSKVEQMRELELDSNRLRRTIETNLYTEMLIPDFRADVLSLLEELNFLLGLIEDVFLAITVERPIIDEPFKADFKRLASIAVKTVESAVLAGRAFFRNIAAVRDHLGKVGFHEEECDQLSTQLKRKIFGSELGLDQKMHLRYFVDKIDNLADAAEVVGDKLAIYSIKRSF